MNRCINIIQPNGVSPHGSPRGCGDAAGEPGEVRFHEEIRFKSGYWMVVSKHTRAQGMRMPFDQDRAPVSLCYNLAQKARCTVLNGGQAEMTFERRAGDGVLSYLPQTRGILEAPQGENVLGISIYFPFGIFMDMFSLSHRLLGPLQVKPYASAARPAFYHQAQFEPETRLALWQVLQCPYTGRVRELFMEAKALELAALKLVQLDPDSLAEADKLSNRAMDQVREAHRILVDRMADPPDLSQLSRMVGLNRNKLNRGFKKLYGDTVFNVLRKARLAKARSLLQHTELSLVEIAFSIGYNSQANFTTAFRRQFGRPPNVVRKHGLARRGNKASYLS